MTAKKINALERQNTVALTHMQIVYLRHYNFPYDKIAEITGYAKSTVKNYVRKFADLLEKAKETFYHITQKAEQAVFGKRQLVYLLKFYDDKNELICSKIGTTTRTVRARMTEEISYYTDHGFSIGNTEVCSVIDCQGLPAEGAESALRAYFIRRYPKTFTKNDRFFGLDISPKTFNKVVNDYLENA